MEKTIQILNELEVHGLVQRFVLGGAMAAFFYSEAVFTEDLDVFILLKPSSSTLITITPIYDFLKTRGAVERREHLLLEGTLVQIIPAYDKLTEEAVEQSVDRKVGETRIRVMKAEHLIAIALKTGRAKDHARVSLLLEEADVDAESLEEIIKRHGLFERWQKFKKSKA